MNAVANTSKSLFGVAVPVTLFFFAIMLPTAVSVSAGGLRLSVFRVLLIVMILPMIIELASGKKGGIKVFDALVFLHCIWVLLALIKWGGIVQGVESGGIYFVECAGAYLIGRVFIRSYEDFVAMAKMYVALVVAMLVFTIPEAVTGVHILHDGISGAVGGPKAHFIEQRMGLERTFGPFDHPILYGVFSASAFSFAYFVIAKRDLLNFKGMSTVVGVSLATFMSASGGPYLVLIMQGFVAAWEMVLSKVKGRWAALGSLFVTAYVAIDLLSTKTPFHVFVNYFTFSKQSAYNRILIFDYGTAEVARHPLFGIGLGEWTRPSWMSDSMDNFWLACAVRYGLPSLILLLALLLGLVVAVARRKEFPEAWRRARHAWGFTLFGISVAAATVHLWNALFVLFFFLIGAGVWFVEAKPKRQTNKFKTLQTWRPLETARLF